MRVASRVARALRTKRVVCLAHAADQQFKTLARATTQSSHMEADSSEHPRSTASWLHAVVMTGDPAGLLTPGAARYMATALMTAGATPSPPFLGGERNPAQLLHSMSECQSCGGTHVSLA